MHYYFSLIYEKADVLFYVFVHFLLGKNRKDVFKKMKSIEIIPLVDERILYIKLWLFGSFYKDIHNKV